MLRAPRILGQVAALICLVFMAVGAKAHEIRPGLAEVSFPDGRWQIAFMLNLEAMIAGVGPEHEDTDDSPVAAAYNDLRAMEPAALKAEWERFAPRFLDGLNIGGPEGDWPRETVSVITPAVGDVDIARDSFVTIGGALPEGATEMQFSWSSAFGAVVFRTEANENGEGYSAYLTGGEASAAIPVAGGAVMSAGEAFLDYLWVGFEHILPLGLDHILFVIGLFLLSTALRPLLIQITAFTLAHTVTLALGALGYISIPGSIVEPLIALSITAVAVENVLSDRLHRWRPVVVFLFGLLHGLGFAGVLSEFGFAPGQFVASLVAFNIGVEIGQLVVIAICFLAVGLWFGKRDWYRPWIVFPASLAIGGYSFGWFIERSLEVELPVYAVMGLTLAIGLVLLSAKGWREKAGEMAGILALAAALTFVLRHPEGMIP